MRAGTMQSSLLGSAAVAIMACASAVAQDDTEREIEQLIIKGLKRDTTFLEVPASVSVFDEEAISNAGVKRPQDYLRLIPNVTFIQANHAGEAFVNIRGQASVRQSESAVAVVIDGVQLSTQNEFNGELFDLQQIEVLKGPQGALYGRNAAAGAIIVTTKSPTDDLEGQATLTAGNWDTYKANASLGGAIVPEKLRFRVAGSVNTSDGPFKNIVTGEDSYRSEEALGRVRLDWLVNENLTLDMRAGISHLTGGATAANAQVAGSTVGGIFVPAADTNNADIPFVADVPGDYPRPEVFSYRGASHLFDLDEADSAAVQRLAQAEGVTPYVVLLGAFHLLLARYCDGRAPHIGTPVANRDREELAAASGRNDAEQRLQHKPAGEDDTGQRPRGDDRRLAKPSSVAWRRLMHQH